MVWHLSLAVPLPYVNGHIFDMDVDGWADAFRLSNGPKGSAEQLLASGMPLRKAANLLDPAERVSDFDVFFDDLKLARPIKFRELPTTNNALKKPLVFIGTCREEFPKPRAPSVVGHSSSRPIYSGPQSCTCGAPRSLDPNSWI